MVLTYPVALAAYARITTIFVCAFIRRISDSFIEMRFLRRVREKEAKINSTLLEASIYDAYVITIPIMNVKEIKHTHNDLTDLF